MNLRTQVIRGGAILVARQGAGTAFNVVGTLVLTRLLGPESYGLYAAAFGITVFFTLVARMGLDVYLVRAEGTPAAAVYHQAFTLLLLSGVGLALLGVLALPLFQFWLHDSRYLPPLQALLLMLPLTVLSAPSVARMERALDYGRVAALEVMEPVLYYVVALPLAFAGFGVWAPVIGYGVSQAWLVAGGCVLARYLPRWHWSPPLVREMLHYGLGLSTSIWVWWLRSLVNPLIVGGLLGPAFVAYVALAIRMVEGLSFVKAATWRMSIAVLARVQGDLGRLGAALEEAMGLQVLALGPLFAGFALAAPWLVPRMFGPQWAPVLVVFPFIALGGLVNAVFSMHTSALYVLKHNREVTIFNAVHIALFATATLLLVPALQLLGWGLAEVIALPSYLVLHLQLRRYFVVGYARAIPWLLAFVPALFVPLLPWPAGAVLWLPALAVGCTWSARHQLQEYWLLVRRRPA